MRAVMNEYLFVFGYRGNTADVDADYEKTGFFRITASDEHQAEQWGRELADRYSQYLSGKRTWCDGEFASWVEHDADEELIVAAKSLPLVPFGENPPWDEVRDVLRD